MVVRLFRGIRNSNWTDEKVELDLSRLLSFVLNGLRDANEVFFLLDAGKNKHGIAKSDGENVGAVFDGGPVEFDEIYDLLA